MYHCTDCGDKFENPRVVYEKREAGLSPINERAYCPSCGSEDVHEIKVSYCRCCGRRMREAKGYCSAECKKRGESLWQREYEKRVALQNNDIVKLSKKIEQYNKLHGTSYSYGYFVANILPKFSRRDLKEYI